MNRVATQCIFYASSTARPVGAAFFENASTISFSLQMVCIPNFAYYMARCAVVSPSMCQPDSGVGRCVLCSFITQLPIDINEALNVARHFPSKRLLFNMDPEVVEERREELQLWMLVRTSD